MTSVRHLPESFEIPIGFDLYKDWGKKLPWHHYYVELWYNNRPLESEGDHTVMEILEPVRMTQNPTAQDFCFAKDDGWYPACALERWFGMTWHQVARWLETHQAQPYSNPVWGKKFISAGMSYVRPARLTRKHLAMSITERESYMWKHDQNFANPTRNMMADKPFKDVYTGAELKAAAQRTPVPVKRSPKERPKPTFIEWDFIGRVNPEDLQYRPITTYRLPINTKELDFTVESFIDLGLQPYGIYPQKAIEAALGREPKSMDKFFKGIPESETVQLITFIPGRQPKSKFHLEIVNGGLRGEELEDWLKENYPRRKETRKAVPGYSGKRILKALGYEHADGLDDTLPPISGYRARKLIEKANAKKKELQEAVHEAQGRRE